MKKRGWCSCTILSFPAHIRIFFRKRFLLTLFRRIDDRIKYPGLHIVFGTFDMRNVRSVYIYARNRA